MQSCELIVNVECKFYILVPGDECCMCSQATSQGGWLFHTNGDICLVTEWVMEFQEMKMRTSKRLATKKFASLETVIWAAVCHKSSQIITFLLYHRSVE